MPTVFKISGLFLALRIRLIIFWQCIQYGINVAKQQVGVAHLVILGVFIGHDKDAAVGSYGEFHRHHLGFQKHVAVAQICGTVREISCPVKFPVQAVAHGFVQSPDLLFADGHILLKIIFVCHFCFCIVAGWLALPLPFSKLHTQTRGCR